MKGWITDHAKGVYWGMVVCFAILAAVLALTERLPIWGALLVYAACCFFGPVAVNFFAYRELRAAVRALDQECDPEPLLEIAQKVLRQNPKSLTYAIYGAYDLLLMARKLEAVEWLVPLENNQRLWKNGGLLSLYCISRAALSDVEEAAAWLDRLEAKAGKLPGVKQSLEQQRACLALRREETEGLEPLFQAYLREAKVPRVILAWHSNLATLYLNQGRRDEAREHLRYVAEHGNKLAARADAENLLKQLDERGPLEGGDGL